MQFRQSEVVGTAEREAYLSWRDKYAEEEPRCSGYDARYAGGARSVLNWLDARMVIGALRDLPAGSRVLDMPCGGGRLSEAVRRAGLVPVAADYSAHMVAASGYAAREGVRVDALRLPFRSRAFPAAVCFRFMQSVPRVFRLTSLAELGRVAGRVLVNYQNALSVRGVKRFLMRKKALGNRVTESQAVAEVEEGGLVVDDVRYKVRFLYEDFLVVARRPDWDSGPEIPANGGDFPSSLCDLLES